MKRQVTWALSALLHCATLAAQPSHASAGAWSPDAGHGYRQAGGPVITLYVARKL